MFRNWPLTVRNGLAWLLLIGTFTQQLSAQNPGAFPPLEFQHRERVVFLGSSLFENELTRGYLEFALASRWPDRELTFRNLGWTGDNVFGEARSTFTNPPTPYQQLLQQITDSKPDYVLIAYGSIESQQGQEGLTRFTEGLLKIIDTVEALGAEPILLSTIPVRQAGSPENTGIQNRNLKLYADAISGIAARRQKRYVDLYSPVQQNNGEIYLANGIHLNDNGYYFLAQVLEKSFGWQPRGEKIVVNVTKQGASAELPAQSVTDENGKIRFSFEEKLLPLPAPASAAIPAGESAFIQVKGLKKGYYTLFEDGKQVATASAAEWAAGVAQGQGKSFVQSEKICEYITGKNNLFFQQYRPLNRTYILGFRAYEQGRHKQGLEDLSFIITWLEGQINLHRKPVSKTYELSPVK